MFSRYRKYFYRYNRRLEKMLLVKENLEIELKDSIALQIANSLTLENDTNISDEVKVHELRKAVKRSRALLRLLKPALDEGIFYDMDEILGKSARSLADQREATVNLRTFINLINSSAYTLTPELKNTILNGLTKKINHSYNLSPNNFSGQLHTSLLSLKRVREKIENTQLENLNNKNLSTLIKKTFQKAVKLYNDAHLSLDTEIIHKWRRINKQLLFQIKLSPFKMSNNTKNMISILENLSDTLGEEHDLAIMEDYLYDNFELSKDEKQMIHLCVIKERSHLQKKAFKLGAKLYA